MDKFNNAMLDIETMDFVPTAKVVQIALVPFNTNLKGEMVWSDSPFIEKVSWWEEQHYATEGGVTMKWWGKQDPDVFQEVFNRGERSSMDNVLVQLQAYCAMTLVPGYKVYCHASFDQPIMAFHAEMNKTKLPWNPFSQVVDLRTLERVAHKMDNGYSRPERDDSRSHDALYDCLYQIEYLARIRKSIGVLV